MKKRLQSLILAVTLDTWYFEMFLCIRPFKWFWGRNSYTTPYEYDGQLCLGPIQIDLSIPIPKERGQGFYIGVSLGWDGPFNG